MEVRASILAVWRKSGVEDLETPSFNGQELVFFQIFANFAYHYHCYARTLKLGGPFCHSCDKCSGISWIVQYLCSWALVLAFCLLLGVERGAEQVC